MTRPHLLNRIKEVIEEVEGLNLPDGAHWSLIHERLNMPYGDVFTIMGENAEFFGLTLVTDYQNQNQEPATDETPEAQSGRRDHGKRRKGMFG